MGDRQPRSFFVTGGTGFLGAAEIALLLRLGCTVYGLVRGNAERLYQALASIDPSESWRNGKLIPVLGDITLPKLGVSADTLASMRGAVDVIIHLAGNTRFDDEGDDNLNINFYGTQNVVEFAEQIGYNRFVHVSTAYVCGRITGDVFETPHTVAAISGQLHNKYEYSKVMAEAYLRDNINSKLVIVRPSIVVGALGASWHDSIPINFEAYYGYFKSFSLLKRKMNEWAGRDRGEDFDLLATRIPGCGDAEINIIPVDNVAEMIYAAATHPQIEGQILHATNPHAPKYEWLVRTTFGFMGIKGGRILPFAELEAPEAELVVLEPAILEGIKPFRGYVGEPRTFETGNMSRIYDMSRIPAFSQDEASRDLVRRLITPALECGFKPLEKRLAAAMKVKTRAVA